MKVTFEIEYFTLDHESLWIGGDDMDLALHKVGDKLWTVTTELLSPKPYTSYQYYVKDDTGVIRRELGKSHIIPNLSQPIVVKDIWKDEDPYQFIYTSAFTNSFASPIGNSPTSISEMDKAVFQLVMPYVYSNEEIRLVGDGDYLGNWDVERGIPLNKISEDTWQIALSNSFLEVRDKFKFVIYNKVSHEVYWEEGENRVLLKNEENQTSLFVFSFRSSFRKWKGSGVAIPVFSLRSNTSFGIGDFADIKKLVDWCVETSQRVIQILPINDTTISKTWKDSYPYNALSVFALHPIYLGLSQYPLKDKVQNERFIKEAQLLNELEQLDYEKVLELKTSYLDLLYEQEKNEALRSQSFIDFYSKNADWLDAYASFCYLRDKYQTADFTRWGEFSIYDTDVLQTKLRDDEQIQDELNKFLFIQYLLDSQLKEVRRYANDKGVVLKGDVPIGISRHSVEAWMHSDLFHLDKQTGAPPDDFAQEGQNWGFPTYNWTKMAEDSYHWWKTRFQKMAEYFDAYRIDHILGFFRIWEIPYTSVHGLLGQFNPALPFSLEEIKAFGLFLNVKQYSKAFIQNDDLLQLSGEYYQQIKETFLTGIENGQIFELKPEFKNQRLIQNYFEQQTNNSDNQDLKNILFDICDEVLFVEDNTNDNYFHPRIELYRTYLYKRLDDEQRQSIDYLYDHFYYHRHNDFWKEEALKKLPTLLSATNMLVCGEDLGMIPFCVPQVMHDLQILSLEIERMPKLLGYKFSDLSQLPYLSVCSTSTHDMSPVRSWWKENGDNKQYYWNHILHQEGTAPEECNINIADSIIQNHLASSSMLTIFPLQDLLAMSSTLQNNDLEKDRINIPAVANHYWRYRMNITIESLLDDACFNKSLKERIQKNNRS